MHDINLIKSRISCVDYAQRIGLSISKSGDRCISPLRSGARNPTSFVVYDDFFYDFANGSGGDVIEFCAAYAHNGNRGEAIRDLAKLTGVTDNNTADNTQEWVDYTNKLNNKTAYYHEQLTTDDRDYLHDRGLTDADINRLLIGRVTDGPLRGRLFLPYFHPNGYVCYSATRALPNSTFPDNKYMKQKTDEHCQHIPWGLQTLNRESDTLVIAEGYFDTVSFECAGYPVLSAITGIFSKTQISTVLSAARNFKRVFIVYDNDARTHAGENFTHRMALLLNKHRIPFIVGTVPTPYHDISEYYAAGGDLSLIISNAENGIQYIAARQQSFEALEAFIYSVARHTKRSELESIFSYLKKHTDYEHRRLDSLLKSATTAPPENIVANEILEKHQLVYIDKVGFYEYTNGVWQRRSDEHINTYSDRAYGEFSTSNRVKSLTALLKTRALRDILFDKNPVWNFINGTLELDTGVFREHNPNDYCSIQSKYPYNPDATYTAWTRFIDDVTAGDPKQAELLQFIPAYVLMPHLNYEKIFVLSGMGGNGKSKYLEILRQLFGEEKTTHVTPRGLLDKFQRILLRDSFINIAGEIRSDLRESEEYLKQIASGEPLTACYKSKDYITFVPRTVLVFATNSQLTSGDTSEGLTRRLIIIDFKVSFVDNPDPNDNYQRPKDINIINSLSEELNSGGIFNWAYEGYKLLKTVGYFTETNDQAELLQDFRRSSNPIIIFYEDCHNTIPENITNTELYRIYQCWCSDNGENFVPARAFHREFKKISVGDFEPYRTNKNRGYLKLIKED